MIWDCHYRAWFHRVEGFSSKVLLITRKLVCSDRSQMRRGLLLVNLYLSYGLHRLGVYFFISVCVLIDVKLLEQ